MSLIDSLHDRVKSTRRDTKLVLHSKIPSKNMSNNMMLNNFHVFQPSVNMLRANDMQASLNTYNASTITTNTSKDVPPEINLTNDEVVCGVETENSQTTECLSCDSHFQCMDFFTHQKQHSPIQNCCAFIILILYVIWVAVIFLVEIEIETLVVVSFAWIWTPVLFLQMCYHLESHKYVYIGFSAYLLLTMQLYGYLTFQNTYEFNFLVDMYMLTQQTVIHLCLRGGCAFPVWSFLITSVLCVVFRILTYGQMEIVVMVSVIHNTYLFVLVVLSIIMYSTGLTTKNKTDCKQP
jgi:hypothetical protein